MLRKKTIVASLISLMVISCNKKENPNYTLSPAESIQNDTLSNTNEIDTLITNNGNSEMESSVMENENIGDLRYGIALEEVINSYGKPDRETEPEFWDADGEYHQKVEYLKQGIELDVVGEPGTKKTINMITIANPSTLKTLKNIGIGSSFKEVENAYKDQIAADFSNSETIVVGSIYGGLIFYMKNNKVESIFIGAAAE